MSIDGLLLLPADVRIVPVPELPRDIRARIDASDQDYTITRSHSRLASSVVDRHCAELLAAFREPARIVDAIVAYAGRLGTDPRVTLEAAYPVLSRLVRMRFLVPADSDRAGPIRGELQPGDRLDGFRLVRRVQMLDDNEVFLARDDAGRYAAVKFYRSAGARIVRSLQREAMLLRRAPRALAPAVLALCRAGSGMALVTEWIQGADALGAAAAFHGRGPARNEHALLALCARIAAAFADLHEAGLLHGDVHPRNVLVEASGVVRLIDFGFARPMRDAAGGDVRGGVPFYFEPEYARALRRRRSTARSAAGEQYSIAALLYQLWTGVHYLDWSLERDRMLRQIVEDDPVGFEARRIPVWPALEQVLRRALDKRRERRFADVRAFSDALRALLQQAESRDQGRRRRRARVVGSDLVARALERYAPGGEALRSGLPQAPFASLNYGAAGVAYALLRIAQRRLDPGLLAAADLWSQKACALATADGAFYSAGLQIERRTVGAISLFHSESGLHCVRALVSAAQGDAGSVNRALRAFVAHSRRPCAADEPAAELDLTLGKGGLLLGCAELVESIADEAMFDLARIRARGEEICAELQQALQDGSIGSSDRLAGLGVAHGWAGLLFAVLRWTRAMGRTAAPQVAIRLQELALLAEPHGAGLHWPVRCGGSSFLEGWCSGSAGYAMLFTLAQAMYPESDFSEVAARAALSAASSASTVGTLCCGQGGIGYALLALHRLTGSQAWLQQARAAAQRAAADRSRLLPRDALFKGALGVALLAEDLENPARAAMPLIEPVR